MVRSLYNNKDKKSANPGVPELATPDEGQIWWATCTITDRILRAAFAYSVVGLTDTMSTTLARVESMERRKERPVIVLALGQAPRHRGITPTVSVVATATFGRSRVTELDRHTQHFALAVGQTQPWPKRKSYVLQPDPDWPRSSWKPCYAVAFLFELPVSCLTDRYTGEKDGPQGVYSVSDDALDDLRAICKTKLEKYEALPPEVVIQWNKSFEAREQVIAACARRAQTVPFNVPPTARGPAPAPAARPAAPAARPAAPAARPAAPAARPAAPAPRPVAPAPRPAAAAARHAAPAPPAARAEHIVPTIPTPRPAPAPPTRATLPEARAPLPPRVPDPESPRTPAPLSTLSPRAEAVLFQQPVNGTDTFRTQLSPNAAAFVPSPSLAQRVQAGIAYITTLAVEVLETLEAAGERPAEESDQAYVSNPDYNNHTHLTSATYVEQDLHQYPAPFLAQAPPPRRDTGHARTQSAPAFSFMHQTQSLPGAPMDVAPRYPVPPAEMYPAPPAQMYPAGYGQQQAFSPPPPGSPVQPAPQYYLPAPPPPPPPQFNPIQQQRVVVGGTTYQNFQMPSNQQMYVDAFTHAQAQAQVQAAQVAAAQAAAAHAHAMQYNGYY
ncbi:hypothetical protein EXIGLDRAFT_772620 [Exidia glandulosa HHB12029]|uniref:Uncharacterized protein n=1 Tax=Exidia glandulosa HHB12029 TaxID=1314781 RepID=A0A165F736_EXIGL|nr:hypothetical protein EXIGLDRAFT_772620 [Exidia glandulosa HHB12029]